MTMLDMKVISALTESSSQSCYICRAKPTQMNNLDVVHMLSVKEDHLKYGLSVLHAYIKLLEVVLHIAYKLDYKKTSLRGATQKERDQIKTRKKKIYR